MTHNAEIDRLMPVIRERCHDPSRQAYLVMELLDAMDHDVAHFHFTKKDGTRRSAFGTREPEIINRYDPKDGEDNDSHKTGTVPFFDIEKRAWRCFRVESLTDIDKDYEI